MTILKKVGLGVAAVGLCVAPIASVAQPSHAAAVGTSKVAPAVAQPMHIVPPAKKDCRKYITWKASSGETWMPGRMCVISTAKFSSWLVFQQDGNLVHYGGNPLRAMWASGTDNRGATRLVFQKDGNVVIYARNQALWSTGTWDRHRPRTDVFSFGIPDRDGIVDSATVVLIENPEFRGGRPTFTGRELWHTTPR